MRALTSEQKQQLQVEIIRTLRRTKGEGVITIPGDRALEVFTLGDSAEMESLEAFEFPDDNSKFFHHALLKALAAKSGLTLGPTTDMKEEGFEAYKKQAEGVNSVISELEAGQDCPMLRKEVKDLARQVLGVELPAPRAKSPEERKEAVANLLRRIKDERLTFSDDTDKFLNYAFLKDLAEKVCLSIDLTSMKLDENSPYYRSQVGNIPRMIEAVSEGRDCPRIHQEVKDLARQILGIELATPRAAQQVPRAEEQEKEVVTNLLRRLEGEDLDHGGCNKRFNLSDDQKYLAHALLMQIASTYHWECVIAQEAVTGDNLVLDGVATFSTSALKDMFEKWRYYNSPEERARQERTIFAFFVLNDHTAPFRNPLTRAQFAQTTLAHADVCFSKKGEDFRFHNGPRYIDLEYRKIDLTEVQYTENDFKRYKAQHDKARLMLAIPKMLDASGLPQEIIAFAKSKVERLPVLQQNEIKGLFLKAFAFSTSAWEVKKLLENFATSMQALDQIAAGAVKSLLDDPRFKDAYYKARGEECFKKFKGWLKKLLRLTLKLLVAISCFALALLSGALFITNPIKMIIFTSLTGPTPIIKIISAAANYALSYADKLTLEQPIVESSLVDFAMERLEPALLNGEDLTLGRVEEDLGMTEVTTAESAENAEGIRREGVFADFIGQGLGGAGVSR